MDSTVRSIRDQHLAAWGRYILDAARQGALTGRPCAVTRIETVAGPRAGALLIQAGMDVERLYRVLSRSDAALLRQFVPWGFVGEPAAFMDGRFLRLEAGWPPDLADTMIRLLDLGTHPAGDGRWVAGLDEYGRTVIPCLSDATPNVLVAGCPGSGKSVALRAAVAQLGRDRANRVVLLDGKVGEGLGPLRRFSVGPVAVDGPAMRNALGWAAAEMRRRYQAIAGGDPRPRGRVVVVYDEFQEQAGDAVIVNLMRHLGKQGRAAGVHLLAATQHPPADAFGDASTSRTMVGRFPFRVVGYKASEVAVGAPTPRADHLLGRGDAYFVTLSQVHRLQAAYLGLDELDGLPGGDRRELDEWPDYEPEDIGTGYEQPGPGRPVVPWTGQEIAVALVSAASGEGRPALIARLKEAGLKPPGTDRLRDLLALARAIRDGLDGLDYEISPVEEHMTD